jgi:hypothetical protein
MFLAAAVEKVSHSSSDAAKPLARGNRKYYNAHRKAIRARRAFKRKRAVIEVGQKVTSAGT